MDGKAGGGDAEIQVLLVAAPAQGHINPMLRLGYRLVSKGLHVTLATTHSARHLLLKANTCSTNSTSASSARPNSQNTIPVEFISDGLPLDYDRANNLDQFYDSLASHGPPNLSALIQSLSHRNATTISCIINNPFVPWVADVAKDHGIPSAMLWIQPCALFAIYYRFYKGLNQFPSVTHPNIPVQLPGLPLLRTEHLPSFVLPSNPWGSIVRTISLGFENIGRMKWVLCNSFYELEEAVVESMNELRPIMPVGPLVSPMLLGEAADDDDAGADLWKADDGCIEWLDKQPASSVLYVSFGSFLVLSEKQMENIAWGIKNSGRPFLWAVKPPEHAAKDRAGQLPLEFMKETEEGGGMVVQWCAQEKVLSHPSVGCFLTHCGWNSTLEAVTAGVPMICHPQWTDQPTNAKLATDVFEVGVQLQVGQDGVVDQEELGRCIAEVMEGAKGVELKKKALDWKEKARLAVRGGGGSSDRNIQLFVDEVKKGTTRFDAATEN